MAACPSENELHSLLQDALGGDALLQLETHLGQCDRCQSRLDQLTDASDLVGAATDLSSVPDSVVAHLRETPHSHLSDTVPSESIDHTFDASAVEIDGFDIKHHIASGATGALYRAIDLKLGRTVAVKVMHAFLARSTSARARLVREARAVAAIDHPNVVSVYSVGKDSLQRPYMAMQLVDGASIAETIRTDGPFSPIETARLLEQTARGLAASHAAGLVHRDVKASNILIDRLTGTAKVVDFGLVREHDQETQLTMDGVLAGTPAYISPEQIVNPTDVDARTDVYSLGIVLYEMLTGVVPFRGVLRMTLHHVEHTAPQPPRELDDAIPSDLQTICLKAIEKDPQRRYQTAQEFADDLYRWQNNTPIHARPVGRFEKAWRWCQRNRRVAVLAGLVAFATASAIGITTASAYRLSIAGQEVREADTEARQNAEALAEQRDAAMDTVRRLVFDVPKQISELRGDTTDVRQSILKIALEGLEKIGRSAESSGEFDLNTAQALQQLGTALIDAGEIDDGERQLRRALTLVQKLEDTAGIGMTASLEQAIHFDLADVSFEREEVDGEKLHLTEAVNAGRKWVQEDASAADAAVALATSLNLMADFESVEGHEDVAGGMYQESRTLLMRVLKSQPDRYDAALELENSEFGLADIDDVELRPEVDRFKRSLQADLRSAQATFDVSSADAIARNNLVEKMLSLAEWHTGFGNPDRATGLCETVVELLDGLDDAASLELAATAQCQQGDALLAFSATKAARNAYKTCLSLVGDTAELLTTEPGLRLQSLRAKQGIAESYVQQGNGRKAKLQLDELLSELPTADVPEWERMKLLISATMGLAWAACYEEDDSAAAHHLADATKLLAELTDDDERDLFDQEWIELTTLDMQQFQLAVKDADKRKK